MTKDKLPWMQFYTGDWLRDPCLGQCSPPTRGIWIDAVAAMHEDGRTGVLAGTAESLARICRCSPDEFLAAADELKRTKTAGVTLSNGTVTLVNRRMKREYRKRQLTKRRVDEYRKRHGNAESNGDVTPMKRNTGARGQKSEVRSQTTEGIDSEENTYSTPTPPPQSLTAENLAPSKYGEKFLLFWDKYPKGMRVDKRESWQIWTDRKLDAEFDEITAGLTKYKRSQAWQKDGGKWIMSPKRFLGETKWDDEPGLSDANRSTI